jgi:hypothetical protein
MNALVAETQEIIEGSPAVVVEEGQTTFGDGVRFGFPAPCAHESDHVCSMDGLASQGPFPAKVELSTVGDDKASFSIEASSWAALLRFMMW